MRLVNHPFRLDSQRLLSYLTSMRVLTLAVTPANSTTFWNTIYFYTASATAGNLSYDCARGRQRTVSAAAYAERDDFQRRLALSPVQAETMLTLSLSTDILGRDAYPKKMK